MTVESGGVEKRITRPGFSITTESAHSPPSDPQPVTSEELDAALSALEGGLESEEEEEDSGGETSQAANETSEESEESAEEDESGAEEGDGKDEGGEDEGGEDEGGGSSEESEIASDEESTDDGDGATDEGGDDGGGAGDDSGVTEVAADDLPSDDDMANSGISELGSDSEPEALSPETESSFDVAFADTTSAETTDEIADDANITDSTQSDATDSLPEAGIALTKTFSGRIKHGTSATAGSDDATAGLNLGFSGATISDGVFDTAAGNGRFTIDIDSVDGSATSTSNPFGTGILSGRRSLRTDQEFVTYKLTDQTDGHRVLAFAGVPTTDFPTTGATFYHLSGDFIMGALFPFIPDASAGTATRGTDETNSAIMWDDTQSATAHQAFGAVVMGKSGTNRDSVVSIFVGEVKTSGSDKYLAGKMRGSTRVGASTVLHTISGAFDTARDGNVASFSATRTPVISCCRRRW